MMEWDLFPPYYYYFPFLCNASAYTIPKPLQVISFGGQVDHLKLVVLKVALKSKNVGTPGLRQGSSILGESLKLPQV